MEGSANATSTELASSLPVAEPPTLNGNRQQTAVSNAQGQTSPIKTEDEPFLAMDGIVEDQRLHFVYNMAADRGAEAELIHVNQHPNNTVDFSAGIQHSQVNECSGNIGSDAQVGNEATNTTASFRNAKDAGGETSGNSHRSDTQKVNAQLYTDVSDEKRGIFVDFDEDADVDNDEERSIQEQDNEIEEDIGTGFGSIEAFVYPETTQIISQHLSTPSQPLFMSLNDLLSSHNAPGRGLYNVQKVLQHEEGRAAELEEKIRYIEAELEEVRARRDRANEIVRQASTTFTRACNVAGIRRDLWEEYEAFCESLEPKFGSRGGWSVTCFEDHNGSYVQWDPELELFLQSAEIPLGSCNFRCEATAVKKMGRTEYVVEFWPLASPEPRTETAKTWKDQYPKLYRLADQAASNLARDNTIAKSFLRSLPDPNLHFSGGWLFEYVSEPGRCQHPTASRRWTYRTACRVPVERQQEHDDATSQSDTDFAASQDEEMEDGASETAESEDVRMEDEEPESSGSQDVKMEDD